MSQLVGTWVLESSENINAYLKHLGMNLAKRKNPVNTNPKLIISNEGDQWTIEIDMKTKGTATIFYEGANTDTSNEMKFTFDARFYFDARRTCMSVFKFETPNKLVQKMKFIETEETQVITREINSDGKLLETLEMNEITATRVFKRE